MSYGLFNDLFLHSPFSQYRIWHMAIIGKSTGVSNNINDVAGLFKSQVKPWPWASMRSNRTEIAQWNSTVMNFSISPVCGFFFLPEKKAKCKHFLWTSDISSASSGVFCRDLFRGSIVLPPAYTFHSSACMMSSYHFSAVEITQTSASGITVRQLLWSIML